MVVTGCEFPGIKMSIVRCVAVGFDVVGVGLMIVDLKGSKAIYIAMSRLPKKREALLWPP